MLKLGRLGCPDVITIYFTIRGPFCKSTGRAKRGWVGNIWSPGVCFAADLTMEEYLNSLLRNNWSREVQVRWTGLWWILAGSSEVHVGVVGEECTRIRKIVEAVTLTLQLRGGGGEGGT